MIEFRTLGALDVSAPNQGGEGPSPGDLASQPKPVALLLFLALARPRGLQRRDRLAALFWPESDQRRARAALSQTLYKIRQALGRDALVSRGSDEVGLAEGVLACDALEFERLLAGGELEQALGRYGGELLPAFHLSDTPEFSHWLDAERARLARAAADAAWTLAGNCESEGNSAGAANWARRAAAIAPWDETALRRLIETLHRLGDRAGARRVYERYRARLAAELKLDPEPETTDLVRHLTEDRRTNTGPVKDESASGVDPSEPEPIASRAIPSIPPRPEALTELGSLGPDVVPVEPVSAWRRRHALGAMVVIVTVVALFGIAWGAFRPGPNPSAAEAEVARPYRLAILPVRFEGIPEDSAYWEGLRRSIVEALDDRPGLVAGLRSSAGIARRDSFDAVLDIQADGPAGHARIAVDLRSSVGRGGSLWEEEFASTDPLPRVLSRITQAVGGRLAVRLPPPEIAASPSCSPADDVAAQHHIMARSYMEAYEPEPWKKAVEELRAAIALEPDCATLWADLAEAWLVRGRNWYDPKPRIAWDSARAALDRAFALAPDLPLAHGESGLLASWFEWDWEQAERSFQHALALDPEDAFTRTAYAHHLAAIGKHDEAATQDEIAKRLDHSPLVRINEGWHRFLAGDYEGAIEVYHAAAVSYPDDRHWQAVETGAHVWRLAQHREGALDGGDSATARIIGDSILALVEDRPSHWYWETGAPTAIALAGYPDSARVLIDKELARVPREGSELRPLRYAVFYGAIGDLETGLDWLERAFEERDPFLNGLMTRPYFRVYYGHPRFQAIRRKMGL